MKNRYNVLCHDHQNMVSAQIQKASETGAELALSGGSADPIFALNATLFLDILDENSGDSMRVPARLARATLENDNGKHKWIYILRWESLPKIILDPLMI